MPNIVEAKHFQPGEGKTFKIGRMSMTFKTTAAEGWNGSTVRPSNHPSAVRAITVVPREESA
jgi:hypothetical protein